MSALIALPGQNVPLWYAVETRNSSLFPVARVYDASLALIQTTPMIHVIAGIYVASFTVPAAQKYLIDYTAYTDAGHTLPEASIGAAQDVIVADDPATQPSVIADAVWDSLTAAHVAPGSFGRLQRLLAAVAGKQFFRLDNIVYNAVGFMTGGRLRVFPSALLASASTVGGTGEGEIETIVLSATPSLTFPDLPTTFVGT